MKKYLFIIGFMGLFAAPVFAELTIDDTVSETYLKNHGYSKASINIVNRQIADANGEEYEKPVEHEIYNTPIVKCVRKFFMYIDPGLDDEQFYNHHNIETTTKWTDL